nr:insulinase family protein [Hyphomicrobiales bacterium]
MSLSDHFEKLEDAFIGEINCDAQLYRHRKTGAEVLSLIGDDENKVFGASFRTPSSDSTGIAHIMEHSVLCGSQKYPVKAPFLEMLKSSLNTFLNAVTFSDKTVYPVASTNLQDFYNLVDVYLDAVLRPRITPEILKQEGWHYELDTPDAQLTYKGVVFNEMKGGYSSPDDRVARLSWRSLFPDTGYGYDSGGDPVNIPELTYDQFKRFHERCYHPSNAKFFFYGNDDPDRRLEILGDALDGFSAIEPETVIKLQPRFNEPRKIEYPVPVNADAAASDKQTRITLNWMLGETGDLDESLAMSVLGSILLGNAAAPLRKMLIDSGLGEGVIGGGYSASSLQSVLSTGLK